MPVPAHIEEHVGKGESFDEFRLEKLFEALKSRGVDLTVGDLMRKRMYF